ncbi:hypothetical protein [Glaciimonas immobilis]|uniref:Uncharacterized protein n=1 Tax=Glaciimonas immobilis TaxID=728004 RepID=A0A840RK97_9BURK|nr:hypothetical protein [Glaciimonas immobilis]KAF3999176.1 hypothetical protein HAV38_04355 [Glaciimonas immobilis]MBB5198627.1 hypothetical protein [Glaciimonas immobilis]
MMATLTPQEAALISAFKSMDKEERGLLLMGAQNVAAQRIKANQPHLTLIVGGRPSIAVVRKGAV